MANNDPILSSNPSGGGVVEYANLLRRYLPIAAVVLQLLGTAIGLRLAPPERDMGEVQRIMYVHVPAVWNGLICLLINFICSVAYLFTSRWEADALAEASAEVGLVFGAIGVLSGSIWGRPTFGVYWAWDPRLTTAAIMLVAYTGYMALRRFVEDPERRAVWSAVVGIIAFVDVPILWFSVRWWNSLHQIQSSPKTVHPSMIFPLRLMSFGYLFAMVCFLWNRYRLALSERRQEIAPPELLNAPREPQEVL